VCKTFLSVYGNAKIIIIKRVFQSYNVKCTATFFGSQCIIMTYSPSSTMCENSTVLFVGQLKKVQSHLLVESLDSPLPHRQITLLKKPDSVVK